MKVIRMFKRIPKYISSIIYFLYYRLRFIGKRKGVAQVVNSFNSGGLEQVASNLYRTFLNQNERSFVITISNDVGPICQQMQSPMHLRIVYYDFCEMLRFCAKNNIGTLIYHFSTFKMPSFKLLGFKTYYIIHNTYIWYTHAEWKKLKFKLKFCDSIISVSEWCKDYFAKKTGIKNIKVILNGIDFKNLQSGEISSITRESLKIKKDEVAILTVGSYTGGKHQMALIAIAEGVLKKHPNVKFITVGPILDKKLYDAFMKNLRKSKVKNNIIVLNYIPQEEMGDFISKNCDIYLQPSIHEAGVPLTVMEALLNKKPVIMTDFMLSKTFPVVDRIIGVRPPYEDILDLTSSSAEKLAYKIYDDSTDEYIEKLNAMLDKLNYYKDESNYKAEDYEFLNVQRMGKEYVDFIKIGGTKKDEKN